MGFNNVNGVEPKVSNVSVTNGAVNGFPVTRTPAKSTETTSLVAKFLAGQRELEAYCNGEPVTVDGQTLSILAIAASARQVGVKVELSRDQKIFERVRKSRAVIEAKVERGVSIYGLSTGFGGSADTRTDKPIELGHALLQHQVSGILPSSQEPLNLLPLIDPIASAMPEAWVRGAMLIRMNSLIRGHSGVRWELIEKIQEILSANVIPVVPLRGSISASGDLSPLSYVAGLLTGNPSIRAFDGAPRFGARQMVLAQVALATHNIDPISLASKEHLGILNGTAFSTSVAALALNDAVHLTLLAQVCTAMCTEALRGSRGSFDPFIHAVARPHPGQIECASNIWNLLEGSKFAVGHEREVSISDDKHSLRQDRYPLRTSPQFLGPQIEDILSAWEAVTRECNSTTDNPLIDGETGAIHHGGNFQAMSVTNAMEKTRLSLHHIGKLLFAQTTELLNPAQNRGLPPSLAFTDPSLNYFGKGVDIAAAAYVSELGHLANPVSTHIQSAELHNQAVNSLALISGRATVNSVDILSMLIASYIYILCQAVDLRALQDEFLSGLRDIVAEEVVVSFRHAFQDPGLLASIGSLMGSALERTGTMDAVDQMREMVSSSSTFLLNYFTSSDVEFDFAAIPNFQMRVAERGAALLQTLRGAFLSGERGATPASGYLGKTNLLYDFVRHKLNIKLHGIENYSGFANGLGVDDVTIGQNISLIYEAIRDGEMQHIMARLFESI